MWVIAASSVSDTVASEHTGSDAKSVMQFARHSLRVCFSSDSDGSSTSVRWAFSFSVMKRPVSVFPVPHAMISWPRSEVPNPFTTSRMAACWCGRGLAGLRRFSGRNCAGVDGQSTEAARRSLRRKKELRFSCCWMVRSPVRSIRSVVAMSIR